MWENTNIFRLFKLFNEKFVSKIVRGNNFALGTPEYWATPFKTVLGLLIFQFNRRYDQKYENGEKYREEENLLDIVKGDRYTRGGEERHLLVASGARVGAVVQKLFTRQGARQWRPRAQWEPGGWRPSGERHKPNTRQEFTGYSAFFIRYAASYPVVYNI